MDQSAEQSKAIQTKKSQFLSFFGDLTKVNTSLSIISAFLCMVCIVLVLSLVRYALTPKPIYYIPGASNAGYSNPNEIPKGSVIGFASSWILSLLNFTPATIDSVHERAKKFMDPKFLSRVRYILDKEKDEATKSSISSVFTLMEDPVVTENDLGLIVTLKGEHALYMAQSNIKLTETKYTVFLRKVPPTDINPYGLIVTNVEQEEKPKEMK